MGLLDRLLARDRNLADTRYAGRESASETAARKRRAKYHSGSATKAARRGQKWEDTDRRRERYGH